MCMSMGATNHNCSMRLSLCASILFRLKLKKVISLIVPYSDGASNHMAKSLPCLVSRPTIATSESFSTDNSKKKARDFPTPSFSVRGPQVDGLGRTLASMLWCH